MKDKLKFDGGTHSRTPMTEDELAAQRQRNVHYDENFMDAETFVKEMGIGWLVDMAKGVPAFLKMFAGVSAILGLIAAFRALGVFG